jgi:hypothetical protein
LKTSANIFIVAFSILILGCSGSKKYFKAAEKLEKQGLVNEAADYYLQSLQRKPTNVEARIKLKEVGQKYVSSLASQFFREDNTHQLEASLETFERLKDFMSKTTALNVQLDYPRAYEEDYSKNIETYCNKNYNQALQLVNQKKYTDAVGYINKIKKYNSDYRNMRQLEIVAICEPLYQSAINSLENKNYSEANQHLNEIKKRTESYKDLNDLLDLTNAQQEKSFILFEPKNTSDLTEKEIEEFLFNNFSQVAQEKFGSVKIINNSPFRDAPPEALVNGTNIDLIQAIRKATGADYFYVYDVGNRQESNSGPSRSRARGFQEVVTKRHDSVITEYKPFDYNLVKAQRAYSYDFKYKLINAYSNQIVLSQTQTIRSQDNVEYQEFQRAFQGNINTLYPYNPQQTAPMARYNPKNWRGLFSARNNLKTFEELKTEALNQNLDLFSRTANNMR